eukprot:scaffold37045_cov62-Phaeocystis_antarctica.AAC.1
MQPGCQRHARGTLWQYQERQQSYTTPDWARGHNGHGTIVTSKPKDHPSNAAGLSVRGMPGAPFG